MELLEDNFEVARVLVRKHLKDHEKRYIHIMGVVEMAEHLAHIYNVDPLKAKFAALLHDYSKYEDSDLSPLSDEDKKECLKYPFLAHAYLSEIAAKEVFKITDEEVLLAIRNHVIGRIGMTRLEEIIFISDFTEKNRVYDACIKCREILLNKSIEEAIIYSYESTMNHTGSEGYEPHPLQLKILKEYKEKLNA